MNQPNISDDTLKEMAQFFFDKNAHKFIEKAREKNERTKTQTRR